MAYRSGAGRRREHPDHNRPGTVARPAGMQYRLDPVEGITKAAACSCADPTS